MALFGELDELVKHARVQTKLLQRILETVSLQVDPEQKRSPYSFSKLDNRFSDHDDDIFADMLDEERSYLLREKFLYENIHSLIPTDESIDRLEDRVQEFYEDYKERKHDNEDNDE
ncbi:hypothetical protein OAJ38_03475 [Rhodobiaceae bacterium]|nr:hypothetical protein [Rhodobiaceae bacterium]